MPAAPVRNHTVGASNTAGATIAATVVTADVAIGSVLVAWVGASNLTTTTPTVTGLDKPAGETNAWVKLVSHDSATATSTTGVRGEMWAIKTTVAWTVATAVTATLSAAVNYRGMLLSEFSGVPSLTVRGTAGVGVSATGVPTASTSGTALGAGDLVLGGAFWFGGPAPTGDLDAVNGSWSAAYTDAFSFGSIMQHKVVSAAGAQTFNPTNPTNTSSAGAVVVALATGNVAPNAPTLTSPANSSTIDRNVAQRFGVVASDPDVGDSQSALSIRYRLGAGAWTTVSATTPNPFYDFAAATFLAGAYEWQAQTTDSQGLQGPLSASRFFTAADTPGVPSITAPISGSTVPAYANVAWSVAAQTNFELRRVADLAGAPDTATVYYTTGDLASAGTRAMSVSFSTNNRWEHVQVRVKAAGLWSAWASIRVFVSYTAPMVPTLTVAASSATASIAVAITNPAPTGGEPVASYNDVFVSSPLDVEYRAASMVPPNSTWIWWTPAAARAYTIRAESVGSNGTRASSAPGAAVVLDGGGMSVAPDLILDGGTL